MLSALVPEGMARMGGMSLIGLLLIVGIILFFFPEPITSGLGVALIVAAALLWVAQQVL